MLKHAQKLLEILGQRYLPEQFTASLRVSQTKLEGMQCLAFEINSSRQRAFQTVDGIAYQRKAEVRHVYPDLMRSPRIEHALYPGSTGKTVNDLKVRSRFFTARNDRHFRALDRVPVKRCVDGALRRRLPHDQRCIVPLHRTRLQLADEIGLSLQRLGNHHQARRILVETMHDAGTRNFSKCGLMRQQCIEQGAAPVSAARVHDQPGLFVEHEDVSIFEHNIQRDVFRQIGKHLRRGRRMHLKRLAAIEAHFGVAQGTPLAQHQTLTDPGLQATS